MTPITRNLAIIIGINTYQPQNGISPLKTAANDATKLASILQNRYQYQVQLLTDTDATLHQLQQLLANLKQGTIALPNQTIHLEESDRLLFYFAGHGIAVDELDNRGAPKGYLVPQDATQNQSTFLPMTDLHDALVELPCRHLLIFLDCCFAGSFRWAGTHRHAERSRKMYRERYERFTNGIAQQVITSAAFDEKALDSIYRFGQREPIGREQQYSPFARLLFQLLEAKPDKNDDKFIDAILEDGIITATEIYAYLQGAIAQLTTGQTPGFCQLIKHDKGEYIFPLPGFQPNQLARAAVLTKSLNPYRGLEPYEIHHNKLFFGRTKLRQKLADFVSKQQLTVVLGSSGSGKSSLVKAGLIPDLDKLEKKVWQILRPICPGERPFTALNFALKDGGLPTVFGGENHEIFNSEKLREIILAWSQNNPDLKLLIVIDQFEELITRCSSDRDREDFLQMLATTLQSEELSNQFRLVVTLRSDFEPQFADTVLNSHWQEGKFKVTPMSREELREAIVEPATARVMFFESPQLVDELIDEVIDMPGALPLLSFTLSELYFKYIQSDRSDRTISEADYRDLGGVMLSLSKRGDRVCKELKREGVRESTIRNVMLRMVTTSGGELTHRPVTASELEYPESKNKDVEKIITAFTETRLLVGDSSEGENYVEPAHDELIRGWPRIKRWLDERANAPVERRSAIKRLFEALFLGLKGDSNGGDRAELEKPLKVNLPLQRELTTAANNWVGKKQKEGDKKAIGFLWDRDPRLPLLEEIGESEENWFNQRETNFVSRSIDKKNKDARRNAILLTGTAAIAIIAAAVFRVQLNISQANLSGSYVNNSKTELENYRHNHAVLMAAEALKNSENLEARKILLENPAYGLFDMLPGHEGGVSSLDFSPDGSAIASGGEDGKIKIWDVVSGAEKISSPDGVCHTENNLQSDTYPDIEYVKFSPDGNLLAISCLNGTVSVWEVSEGVTKRFELKDWYELSDNMDFNPIDFTADSSTLIVALDDGTIRFVNVDSGREEVSKRINNERVDDLVVARDRPLLIYASYDKITLWDTEKNEKIKSWQPSITQELSAPNIWNLAFDPNQNLIATGTDSNTIWLWNTQGELIRTLNLFPLEKSFYDTISQIAFGKDGLTIIASKPDGSLVVWAVQDGSLLQIVPASEHELPALALSPDGTLAATGEGTTTEGKPSSIRLWDLTSNHQRAILPHRRPYDGAYNGERLVVNTIDTHPNNKELASGIETGEVYIWGIENQQILEKINVTGESSSSVQWVAYTEDGNFLVSLSGYKVKFFDANNYELIGEYDLIDATNSTSLPFDFGAIDNNNNLLATTSYNAFQLWKLELKELSVKKNPLLLNLESHSDRIAFSPDGKNLVIKVLQSDQLLVKNLDALINNIESKNSQVFPTGHGDEVKDFAFSSQGLLATSSNNSIFIWSYPQFKKLGKPIEASANHLAFSPNEQWLASADGDTVYLWQVSDRQKIAVFPTRHPIFINELVLHQIEALTFSKDGKRLFSSGYDGTIQMWNLDSLVLNAETIAERNQLLTGWKLKEGQPVPLDNWHERAENSAFFQSFRKSVSHRIQSFSDDWKKNRENQN